MAKYLRLYNKEGELLKTSKNIEGNTGVITIENLFPETLYHEGDFLVSWVINGNELSKAPVPEFRTLELMDNKTIVVYFSDITEEQLIALKGDSAYKIALDNGFRGTQQDWLASLKGEPGEQGEPGKDGVDITEGGSAYEIALSHGFEGTKEEWLASLKGEPGEQGEPGEKGDPGEDGFDGLDGDSAYDIAVYNGFRGNIKDFLESLKGEPGNDGKDFKYSDFTEEQLKKLKGDKGDAFTYQDFTKEQLEELGNPIKDELTNYVDTETKDLKEKVDNDDFYNEITYNTYVDDITDTTYKVITIPHKDSNGEIIRVKRGFAKDQNSNNVETAREFSNRNNVSLAINSSVFNTTTNELLGIQIQDGNIISDKPHKKNYTLGIKEDNTLKAYPSDVSAQDIIDDGSTIAVTGFFPIIQDGERVDESIYDNIPNTLEKNPRQIIAQLDNKDILVITIQGRDIKGKGMDYNDVYRICKELNVKFAYHLDGGGSIQSTVRGSLINQPIDSEGTKERPVTDFLYVSKYQIGRQSSKSSNIDFGNHSKDISDLKVGLDKLINNQVGDFGEFRDKSTFVEDANKIRQSGTYWITNKTENTPGDYSYGLIHWQVNNVSALQMIVPFHINLGETLIRRTNGDMDTWTNWRSDNKQLNEIVDKIYKEEKQVVKIYVRKNGNDNTGNGTTSKPYQTIQKAVDTVPKLINRDYEILVGQGEYEEEVVVKGIGGSAIWISREDGIVDPSSIEPNVKVRSVTFFDCNGYCRVNSLQQFKASTITRAFIRFSRVSYGTVHGCRMDDDSITGRTLEWDGSGGGVNNCYFNNQKECVTSMNGSKIRVDSTNKHGNNKSDKGIISQAADVFCQGDIEWVNQTNTPLTMIQGGNINRDTKTIDLNLQGSWKHYSDSYKARAIKLDNGLVILDGIITGGEVGQGKTAFVLPSNFKPMQNQIINPYVSDNTVGKMLIDKEGSCAIEVATEGEYVSLSNIVLYTGN